MNGNQLVERLLEVKKVFHTQVAVAHRWGDQGKQWSRITTEEALGDCYMLAAQGIQGIEQLIKEMRGDAPPAGVKRAVRFRGQMEDEIVVDDSA